MSCLAAGATQATPHIPTVIGNLRNNIDTPYKMSFISCFKVYTLI